MKVSWFAAAALLFQIVTSPIRTATVDGTVLDAGSGEPVSGARVQLFRAAPVGVAANLKGQTLRLEDLQPYSATTEQDGRFRFANVQPGEYRLLALREGGYVPGEYGQRSATGYGTSFVLTPGQDMNRVRLVVTPTGAIAGRVYDRDGPVGRWQVQALRPIYRDGQRTLTIVQAVLTDDRGEYRLFWLPPGSYYVMARPFTDHNPTPVGADRPLVNPVQIREPIRGGSIEQASPPVVRSRTLPDGDVVDEVQLPIYYPGTTDERAASKIDLRAGANAEGFDLAVTTGVQRARRIRGVVVANGLPVAAAEVLAIAQHSSASLAVPAGRSAGDGSFEITGSVPGSYLVFARTNAGGTGAVAVQVGDSDVDQVVIPIVADIRLTGSFIIEGQSRNGANPDLSNLRVTFRRDPDIIAMPEGVPSFSPPPASDGSFEVHGMSAGDFRVSVRALPPDAYIKTIRMKTADVLQDGLHITGPNPDPLEIVIVADAGRLSGTVVTSKREPIGNAIVALVPRDLDPRRLDLFKSARTDDAGHFQLRGISAGAYVALAWEDVEDGAWQNPEFVQPYETQGTTVSIHDGSDTTVQLTAIPVR